MAFHGIITCGYSNSFNEFVGHIGNVLIPDYRKSIGYALMMIKINGVSLDLVDPLIKSGIDFWIKMGYHNSCSSFRAKDIPSCIRHVEKYKIKMIQIKKVIINKD